MIPFRRFCELLQGSVVIAGIKNVRDFQFLFSIVNYSEEALRIPGMRLCAGLQVLEVGTLADLGVWR